MKRYTINYLNRDGSMFQDVIWADSDDRAVALAIRVVDSCPVSIAALFSASGIHVADITK